MAARSGIYGGMTTAERTTERRQRLVDATLTLWADPDAKVTMTAICAGAGLTERYFYESFRNRDDALTAVLDAVATEIDAVTRAAVGRAGPDPVARVRAAVDAFVRLMVDDPRKGRVAIIEAGAMPALRGRRTALLREFAHRATLDAERLYGLPAPRGGDVAGLLFIGGMAELVTAWLDGALDAGPDDIVDAATRMFVSLTG